MIKTLPFYILVSLFVLGTAYSQDRTPSKKEIQTKISNARNALSDLDCEKSLRIAEEALKDSYAINDNLLIAKSYNVIGSNFLEFLDTKKAKMYYNKSLQYANLTTNDTIKDWVYNNLGALYSYYENDFEKGIEYYKKGLIYTEKTKDPIQITYNSLNIAGAYFSEDLYDEGLPFLQKAERNLGQHNEVEARITYYSQLGSYLSAKGKNQEAEASFHKAISFGEHEKTNLLDSYLAEVYSDFSLHYLKNKNYQKAYHYLDLNNKLKEEIYNADRTEKVRAYENKLEIDEYKRQIDFIEGEKLRKEKSLQQTWIIIILCLVSITILIAFAFNLFRNNKLRKKNYRELEQANHELEEAKNKAEEVNQLKSQFVTTITHELRTPLYGVIGITDIISEEYPELNKSKYLSSLKFSAKYLLSLVNDILQMNKITEKKIILENLPFDLRYELDSIKNSLQMIAQKNRNEIVVTIDDSVPQYIISDKIRLSQIFMNLISNSLKFTENGKVEVVVNALEKDSTTCRLQFEVIDNGIGISKEDHDKIFEEFVQIERREDDYQGTGLGLPIVKKLVELFGGEINLESEENIGTKIAFTLKFDYDAQFSPDAFPGVVDTLHSAQNNGMKVLLVEDNKINQVVTERILSNFGFETVIVESGAEAIAQLQQHAFDVVLMDINMPQMNGFETTKLIRSQQIDVPVIALTAFDKQEINEDIINSGMNGVMIKPFEPSVLHKMIVQIITAHKKENLSTKSS
ncbi:tetratricopeptide repeat-containing hybrid sensor histidine kinase/response regulator [Flavobacterium sp. GCM10027622]|uniref:tetratricopeptide repeat-containing hybrid sensor histidine kinase/response regulator n=1 Tax=unclassified Flavobacterium TaxID=196869 RepID=UPI00362177CC